MTKIRMANSDLAEAPFVGARRVIAALPALPSHIRYLDEYEDEWRTIQNPAKNDKWSVVSDTVANNFDFTLFETDLQVLLKHFLYWVLNKDTVRTAQYYYSYARTIHSRLGAEWYYKTLERALSEWEHYWNVEVRACEIEGLAVLLRKFLHFMCDMSLGEFRPVHDDFVRSFHFIHWHDKYTGVESGESILTADEEAKIIEHLDRLTQCVKDGAEVSDELLLKTCLLGISYQHSLRPIQIGRINLEDLRIYTTNDKWPLVHFTAYRAKKRTALHKTPFIRKIKREWAPLFVEYQNRRMAGKIFCASEHASESKLFPITIPTIKAAIGDIIEAVTGTRRTATDLRHSAAQRLADAGASMDEVAEFLGHSQVETSLVYFESSPTQAAKVNKALAISPIYSKVMEVARTGTIDKAALLDLPADNQAAGVPHGVQIAGIGACTLGQSLCAKNPVLSCYTCQKFIPLNEPAIHTEALNGLRSVVRFFYDESRGDNQSPAFVQLRTTLESIQAVIQHLQTRPGASLT